MLSKLKHHLAILSQPHWCIVPQNINQHPYSKSHNHSNVCWISTSQSRPDQPPNSAVIVTYHPKSPGRPLAMSEPSRLLWKESHATVKLLGNEVDSKKWYLNTTTIPNTQICWSNMHRWTDLIFQWSSQIVISETKKYLQNTDHTTRTIKNYNSGWWSAIPYHSKIIMYGTNSFERSPFAALLRNRTWFPFPCPPRPHLDHERLRTNPCRARSESIHLVAPDRRPETLSKHNGRAQLAPWRWQPNRWEHLQISSQQKVTNILSRTGKKSEQNPYGVCVCVLCVSRIVGNIWKKLQTKKNVKMLRTVDVHMIS